MPELYLSSIFMCVVSTVIGGPMPQDRIDFGQIEDEQKYVVDRYTTGLMENPRIRENYLNCFLDNGPCSPRARHIKRKYTYIYIYINQ